MAGLVCLVLSPFAFFQIITKAGYSGWWTFVPYAPTLMGILGAGVFSTVSSNESIGTDLTTLGVWDLIILLTSMFVVIMFFVFAFSAWPSLQSSRLRPGVQPGWPQGGGPGRPSWTTAPPVLAAAPYGAASTRPPVASSAGMAPEAAPTQSSGWYRSGAVGSGEQGYWDGQAWTARRQWKNGAWVDLPMPTQGSVVAGNADAS
jgi:hypothetical protein